MLGLDLCIYIGAETTEKSMGGLGQRGQFWVGGPFCVSRHLDTLQRPPCVFDKETCIIPSGHQLMQFRGVNAITFCEDTPLGLGFPRTLQNGPTSR